VKLVLQCAMCGTHHPVGTTVCSTCRASGVTQLRLMFECQSCGRLDLNPVCANCPRNPPPPAVYPAHVLEPVEDLIVAEEVVEEPFTLEEGDEVDFAVEDFELDFDEDEDEDAILDEDEVAEDIIFDVVFSLPEEGEKTEFDEDSADRADDVDPGAEESLDDGSAVEDEDLDEEDNDELENIFELDLDEEELDTDSDTDEWEDD